MENILKISLVGLAVVPLVVFVVPIVSLNVNYF